MSLETNKRAEPLQSGSARSTPNTLQSATASTWEQFVREMDDQVQQHKLLNPYPAPVALLCDDVISERTDEELESQVDAALDEPAAMNSDPAPAEEGRPRGQGFGR